MCGIAGILSADKLITIEKIKVMTDAIIHRGPDGEGHWINSKGTVGLGHRRLSIIDLSDNGKQPMHYANDRFTITFNGEIYNYIELKADLVKRGYQFASKSDTEVLLALYHLKGETCLSDLDGMFAFAIWDEQEQVLFCARDRFGEKPFYYQYIPGKAFYFASEMKALWAIGVPKVSDVDMLALYLKTGAVMDGNDVSRTFYKEIKQLDAAHSLTLRSNCDINIKRYYNFDYLKIDTNITRIAAAERFYELLKESVSLRLRSDVPVGSSLSGGLDSSSIVMLIDYLKGDTTSQNTFSARFEGFSKDEGKHIHKVLKACKQVTSHEVWPTGEQMSNDFNRLVYHQEEPFGGASIFAQWKVMELAKQKNVIVLLDGQGADEYLAGYMPFYASYLSQLYYTDPIAYAIELKAYNSFREHKIKRMEEQETFRMKLGKIKRKLLNQPMPYNTNALRSELYKQTMVDGLKTLLRYADRNAMAHSREVRLPFLSHKLVEFVFSLPDSYKLYEGWTKWILRDAMKTLLPADICWRVDKIGYEPPQENWLETNPEWKLQIEQGAEKFSAIAGKNETHLKADNWKLLMLRNYFH